MSAIVRILGTGAKIGKPILESKAVNTAIKATVIGAGVGAGGILAGEGVNAAVVKPFEKLGLVTSDNSGKTTLSNTGKFVVIGLIGILVLGIGIYLVRGRS